MYIRDKCIVQEEYIKTVSHSRFLDEQKNEQKNNLHVYNQNYRVYC